MKIFNIDLMTVLFIVVLIGVIATMTTQANDHSLPGSSIASASTPVFSEPGLSASKTQGFSKQR